VETFEIEPFPLYWRLRSETDSASPVPELYPFIFSKDSDGLLVQARDPKLLSVLNDVYSLDYNIGYIQEGYGIAEPYLSDFWQYLERTVATHGKNLRILEVGCGGALLLDRLRGLGHSVVGIDPSPLSERASKALGIEIHKSMLAEGMDIGTFDLIFSMDVLEHAFDPHSFLTISADYLRDDGIVVTSVPDAGPSIELNDLSCAMHQHLQYFSDESLASLLRGAGFLNILVEKSSYGGSLYATAARKESLWWGTSSSRAADSRPAGGLDFEKLRVNLRAVAEHLTGLLDQHGSLGIYAPLRALPYLSELEQGFTDSRIRFIDDTGRWHRRFFDGSSIAIENFEDVRRSPPGHIAVFSLTFEEALLGKISAAGLGANVSTLREVIGP
jgi:2-polyprenyl-3-methyl-5-hydroxy-6-metoxy-1,4-benzoquinol methylase